MLLGKNTEMLVVRRFYSAGTFKLQLNCLVLSDNNIRDGGINVIATIAY